MNIEVAQLLRLLLSFQEHPWKRSGEVLDEDMTFRMPFPSLTKAAEELLLQNRCVDEQAGWCLGGTVQKKGNRW